MVVKFDRYPPIKQHLEDLTLRGSSMRLPRALCHHKSNSKVCDLHAYKRKISFQGALSSFHAHTHAAREMLPNPSQPFIHSFLITFLSNASCKSLAASAYDICTNRSRYNDARISHAWTCCQRDISHATPATGRLGVTPCCNASL